MSQDAATTEALGVALPQTDKERRAWDAQWEAMNPGHASWCRCPMCGLRWLVTPSQDYFLPACGHYANEPDEDGERVAPCEPCGLPHAWKCPDRPVSGSDR